MASISTVTEEDGSGNAGTGGAGKARLMMPRGLGGWHEYPRDDARSVGHDLKVVERIRVEGQHPIYKHEITGPNDKRDEREVTFDVPSQADNGGA